MIPILNFNSIILYCQQNTILSEVYKPKVQIIFYDIIAAFFLIK